MMRLNNRIHLIGDSGLPPPLAAGDAGHLRQGL